MMAQNFLPAQVSTLTPDSLDFSKIQRRQALAEALLQEAAQPINPQRMSGRFMSAVSPLEGLAKLAQTYVGISERKKADKEVSGLMDARKQRTIEMLLGGAQSDPQEATNPDLGAPYNEEASSTQTPPQNPFPARPDPGYMDLSRAGMVSAPSVNVRGQTPQPQPQQNDPLTAYRQQLARMVQAGAMPADQALQALNSIETQMFLANNMPRELNQGAVYGVPGQAPIMANPKPFEPRPAQFIESGAGVDAQGRPLTVKKLYDPEKGAVDIPGVLPETRGPLVNNQNVVGALEKEENKAKGKRNIDVLLNDAELAESASAKALPKLKSMLDINSKIKTGWDSPTREAFSAGLNAIGIKDAAKYATNAETFRAFMNDQVLQEQIAQKGPQTESDARRLEQTQARLTNTNEANDFLIRFRIAQQNSSVGRAKFYRKYWDQNKTLEGAQEAYDQGPGSRSLFDDPILSPYAKESTQPASPGAPIKNSLKAGAVVDGYRFKGGNPNDQSSWERVK